LATFGAETSAPKVGGTIKRCHSSAFSVISVTLWLVLFGCGSAALCLCGSVLPLLSFLERRDDIVPLDGDRAGGEREVGEEKGRRKRRKGEEKVSGPYILPGD
jgi:hypothetical protein